MRPQDSIFREFAFQPSTISAICGIRPSSTQNSVTEALARERS
jgi:hypothetical protein